jgi:drug/metabolite transporter (DMT)-like permease
MSRAARAYLGLSLTSLLWAGAFIAGKLVTAELTPLAAAGLRHLAAALVLLPFAWRTRRAADLRAALPSLAVMALCGGVLYQWAFMAAVQRTSATNAALLVALNPAITVLLAPLVGEALTSRRLLGIALALAGATIVITHGDLAILAGLASARRGDLLALGAACLWAIFNLASRGVVAHLPHSMTNAITYGVGSLVSLSLALPMAPFGQLAAASAQAVAGLAFLVVFASVLSGQLFLFGVHTVGVGRTVVFVYLVPVLTALLSAALLGEPLLPSQLLGGALVLLGVAVTTRPGAPAARRAALATPLPPPANSALGG